MDTNEQVPTQTTSPSPNEPVETPNTNTEPVAAPQAPDMHGFTPEDLAGMRTFIDNNGGWDKIKSRISNPQPAQPVQPQEQYQPQQPVQQYQQPQPQPQPQYTPPDGAITPQEFLAQQYFQGLSRDPKYEAIAPDIASGSVLKEMASFNIQPMNRDGSINDVMVRRYLDLKAQTVPAKPTASEPNAGAAPTVTYTEVGDNITSMDQAYKVLMEPGNPGASKAEAYIKEHFSKNS